MDLFYLGKKYNRELKNAANQQLMFCFTANNKYTIAKITAVGSIQLELIRLEIISHCNTKMPWVTMPFI